MKRIKFSSKWVVSPLYLVVLLVVSLSLSSCVVTNNMARLQTQLTARKILLKDNQKQLQQLENDKRELIISAIALESDTIKLRFTIDSLKGEYSQIIEGGATQVAAVRRQAQSHNQSRRYRSKEEVKLRAEYHKIEQALTDVNRNLNRILAEKIKNNSVSVEKGINWVSISIFEDILWVEPAKVAVDTVEVEVVVVDSIKVDTVGVDSVVVDSIEVDTVGVDSVVVDSVVVDSVELDSLPLEVDSVELKPQLPLQFINSESTELKELVAYLKVHEELTLLVVCYLPGDKSSEEQQMLALERGAKVAAQLSKLNFPENRVSLLLKHSKSDYIDYSASVVVNIVIDSSTLSAAVSRMVAH